MDLPVHTCCRIHRTSKIQDTSFHTHVKPMDECTDCRRLRTGISIGTPSYTGSHSTKTQTARQYGSCLFPAHSLQETLIKIAGIKSPDIPTRSIFFIQSQQQPVYSRSSQLEACTLTLSYHLDLVSLLASQLPLNRISSIQNIPVFLFFPLLLLLVSLPASAQYKVKGTVYDSSMIYGIQSVTVMGTNGHMTMTD